MNVPYIKLFSLSLLILIFVGCSKEKEKWAYYNQTQCADPWGEAHLESDLLFALANYFNQIEVRTLSIVFSENSELHVCSSCGCYTGKVIEVKATESNIRTLSSHGFIPFEKEY